MEMVACGGGLELEQGVGVLWLGLVGSDWVVIGVGVGG